MAMIHILALRNVGSPEARINDYPPEIDNQSPEITNTKPPT